MKLLSVMLLCGFFLSGCTQSVYHIDMQVDDKQMLRKLSVWKASAENPPKISTIARQELERIEQIYGAPTAVVEDDKHLFSGRFSGSMPADVGGAGYYTQLTADLGKLHIYNERFRGDDNLLHSIEQRNKAVDRFVDLICEWLNSEIEEPELRARLQTLMDAAVRVDLKNLSLYAWAESTDRNSNDTALLYRCAQYLVEREYFAIGDLPSLSRSFESGPSDEAATAILRIVANKLTIDANQPLPAELLRLGDWDYAVASLREHLRHTPEFQELATKCRLSIAESGKTQAEIDPLDVFDNLLLKATWPGIMNEAAVVEVVLRTQVEPIATNGHWVLETGTIDWSHNMDRSALPSFCFALWAEPDHSTQERHFGRVLLFGEPLAKYVSWYHSLTEQEASEWHGMLEGLTPESAAMRLGQFRFTVDKQRSEIGCELLLECLETPNR